VAQPVGAKLWLGKLSKMAKIDQNELLNFLFLQRISNFPGLHMQWRVIHPIKLHKIA